jgi:hypothetical protein
MDVATDIDCMIERRSRQSGQERPEEVMYAESVRRYHARRRKEIRAQWYAYHADQADRLRRTMEPLIAFHEARAAALLEGGDAM